MRLFPRAGKLDHVILGSVREGSLRASDAQLQRSLQTSERMRFFFPKLSNFCLRHAEIDAAEVEARADDILGPMSGSEYDLLQTKLGGTRGNRVFSFFEIEASQRFAEAQIAIQKAATTAGGTGGATAALEKKKRKRGGSGPP